MASSSGTQQPPNAADGPDWSDLPRDLTLAILEKLSPAELLEGVDRVCKTWRNICKEERSLWRYINYFHFKGNPRKRTMKATYYFQYRADKSPRRRKMTIRAIDLSGGQLVHIAIEGGNLLRYTAERASQLRRLEIHHCQHNILMEVLAKLPQLEELQVHDQPPQERVLETIGSCCGELKSLKIEKDDDWSRQVMNDYDARAIGRCMPRLRHLEIDGMALKEGGLRAVLDGCPQLESLTLSSGHHQELAETLAKQYLVKIECTATTNSCYCNHQNESEYYSDDDTEEEEEERCPLFCEKRLRVL